MLVCAMGHLDIERNASVRAFVEKRIADHYEGSRSAYAKAAKLSPSVVSELLNGGRGAGLRVVDRIAAEAGVSPDVVTGRASNDDASAAAELERRRCLWHRVGRLRRLGRERGRGSREGTAVARVGVRARVAIVEACKSW